MSVRPIASSTLRAQRAASDPHASAWVSAHAGSGKTHVLAQRAMRLLLAGAAPSHILCLTFTKAAAANMCERIFERLARWTRFDDPQLASEIEDMGLAPPQRAELAFARGLFARVVETPGGLKIQTIHAFCEKLLHLFPFESNTPAGFRVVDDSERAELMEAARRRALERAARSPGELRDAIALVARDASEFGFDRLCNEVLRQRAVLSQLVDSEDYARRLHAQLNLREDETITRIERDIVDGGEPPAEWPALARALRRGSKTDGRLAASLERAYALAPHPDCIAPYLSVFFNADGEPRGLEKAKIITKPLMRLEPLLLELLERERDRLAPLVEKRKAARAAERSLALARVGDAILSEYMRAKRYRNLLDYDDLIERAQRLLKSSNPSWVLYKLDSQIDHILLDEAQDTSAAQWDILTSIADEFSAGAGARRIERSFFAVGDEKQSIFSFQGAAPEKFDEMRRKFEIRFSAMQRRFANVRLTQSFRSAPGILEAVDRVFEGAACRRGLSFDPQEPAPRHEAWKTDLAALLEIWEPIGATDHAEPRDWTLPLDFVDASDPAERLARKVAQKIAALLAPGSGECVEDGGGMRPVEAGDILILVRKRGSFFESVIRALKAENVPVAGADRLELAKHISIDDLVALGRVALLVEDDLTLATLLKSPFLGFDDDDLIMIAPDRTSSLYDALAQSEAPRHREAVRQIDEWRRDARRQAPFEFFYGVLGRGGGRSRLVARLGAEANDAIDEFLRLAMAHEREQAGSLAGFLKMIDALDLSIKRDMEAASRAVRVMTVHAAKGLEAKIVFLPDTCGAPSAQHDPKLFHLGDPETGALVWSLSKSSDPASVVAARARHREAEQDEHQRLLYVALTRAEERLYVAGYHGVRGRAEGCWYDAIRGALEPRCETAPDPLDPESVVLRRGGVGLRHDLSPIVESNVREETPAFARLPAPREEAPLPPLRPSSAFAGAEALGEAGAHAGVSRDEAERLLAGRLTHALLQYLPDCALSRREEAAAQFLALRGPGLGEVRRNEIARAALAILEDARFAPLFGSESVAEVEIVATLECGLSVAGRIDRLAETETEVLIADFKTGCVQPVPSAETLRQLSLYRAAAAPIYPGKSLRCFVIWTQDASIVEAKEAELDAAFKRAAAGRLVNAE